MSSSSAYSALSSNKKDAPKAGDGNRHSKTKQPYVLHKKDAPKAGDGKLPIMPLVRRMSIKKMPLKQGTEKNHLSICDIIGLKYKKDAPKAGDGKFVQHPHIDTCVFIKKMPLKQGTEKIIHIQHFFCNALYKKDAPKAGDGKKLYV